tara:strand:- start:1007 stop:1384 length:378 start_codon:yes stop_codon:yes gene_type:complete
MIYIYLIPNDILENYIFKYIDNFNKIFLNKQNYIKYHYLIQNKLNHKIFESYIRDIIRLDYSFVFNEIIKENLDFWMVYNKYIRYQHLIFPNYYEYINYLINKNNSGKIKNLIFYYTKVNNCKKI